MESWIMYIDEHACLATFLFAEALQAELSIRVLMFGGDTLESDVSEAKGQDALPECIVFLINDDTVREQTVRDWHDAFPDAPMIVVTDMNDDDAFIKELGAVQVYDDAHNSFARLCEQIKKVMGPAGLVRAH